MVTPKILAFTMAICAATGSVPATAQAVQSPGRIYHLMQLSVDTAKVPLAEFITKTSAIRSCGDAKKLGKALNADVRRNRFKMGGFLPSSVRDMLEEVPTGQASEVFTNDGVTLRVLMVCHRR